MKPYYEHAGITIYHGDCREVLPTLPRSRFAVMFTDPPYGVSGTFVDGKFKDEEIAGDSDNTARDAALCWNAGEAALVFGSWKSPRPIGVRAILVWDKGEHIGSGNLSFPWKTSWEEVYVFGDGFAGPRTTGVLRYNAISPNFVVRDHPTEKPLRLIKDLLLKCPVGPVMDPFMGSGTTLVAAKRAGLTAIGIEIEERYCEIAAKRLSQEVLPLGPAWGTALRDADEAAEQFLIDTEHKIVL